MVVVPLERGAFGTAVLGQVVDVAFAGARFDQQVVAGDTRREVARDVAVIGEWLGRGQPARLAVELGAVVAAVQVDGQFTDLGGKFVVEGDLGPLPRRAADRRPGEAAAEGPELGLAAGEDLLLGEPDRDLDLGAAEDRRDRQWIAERDRGLRRAGALEPGERPADPAAGQRREERAAAQGAEELPAPQAGRDMSRLVRQLRRSAAAGP
jgi:hypothetical protein